MLDKREEKKNIKLTDTSALQYLTPMCGFSLIISFKLRAWLYCSITSDQFSFWNDSFNVVITFVIFLVCCCLIGEENRTH